MRRLISLSLILLASCGYTITEKATNSLQPHGVGFGGPTRGLVHNPTVVLVGDSVMGAWLTPEVLAANPTWTAQTSPPGVEETTAQILARFPAAVALKPQVIVLQAGTWDMAPAVQYDYMCMTVAETTAATPCANMASMISEAENAGMYPIVCTIPPGGPQTTVPGFSTGLNINWFNYNLWAAYGGWGAVEGAGLADFYALLSGANSQWGELGPMQDSYVYQPQYTTDGIDPDQEAGQLMVQLVQQVIQASHAGGAR